MKGSPDAVPEVRRRVSVVTPTFQRAGTLPRLRQSLLEQDPADFEWVVVDDGSTDGTDSLVHGWASDSPFPINYVWQANRGKHSAVNRGFALANCELCAVMDSDDWYVGGAIASMLEHWDSIPAERREAFANVEGLCAEPGGAVIGDRFPEAIFDSDTFSVGAVHGVTGDKIGMYRRSVLLAHPFPEDLGWHVSPALVWNRIAARYSTRFVDQIWAHKEYLSEGLSSRETELRLRFAAGELLYWQEFAAMPRPMPARAKLRAHANYIRYSLLERRSLRTQFALSPSPPLTAAVWPIGWLLSRRDRSRAGRGE